MRSEPNRGTYVREAWQRGMLELYEVRAALEEFATRTATPVLQADTSVLWDAIDGMARRPDALCECRRPGQTRHLGRRDAALR